MNGFLIPFCIFYVNYHFSWKETLQGYYMIPFIPNTIFIDFGKVIVFIEFTIHFLLENVENKGEDIMEIKFEIHYIIFLAAQVRNLSG